MAGVSRPTRRVSGVVLYSRPGNDITKRFPAVAEAVAALPVAT